MPITGGVANRVMGAKSSLNPTSAAVIIQSHHTIPPRHPTAIAFPGDACNASRVMKALQSG
jgi:hypothetical protein